MRGNTVEDGWDVYLDLFQFTPLREGQPAARLKEFLTSMLFQFTPLREGQPVASQVYVNVNQFQFTPLREGQLPVIDVVFARKLISIHAPA